MDGRKRQERKKTKKKKKKKAEENHHSSNSKTLGKSTRHKAQGQRGTKANTEAHKEATAHKKQRGGTEKPKEAARSAEHDDHTNSSNDNDNENENEHEEQLVSGCFSSLCDRWLCL